MASSDGRPGSSKSTFYTAGFEDNFVTVPNTSKEKSPGCIRKSDNSRDTEKSLLSSKKHNPYKDTKVSSTNEENEIYSGLLNPIPSPLQCYAVRLRRGDELRKTLLSFVEKNNLKAAFVLSCVGSATSARLRMATYAANQDEPNYVSFVDKFIPFCFFINN